MSIGHNSPDDVFDLQSADKDKEAEGEDISLLGILAYNKPEMGLIILASLTSAIVGFSTPLFAILFGDIIGVRKLLRNAVYKFNESVNDPRFSISQSIK